MPSDLNSHPFIFDPNYEFSAPHFFDFSLPESDEDAALAERWFDIAPSHPVSPFVGKVKSAQDLSKGCSLVQFIEAQKLIVRVSSELPKGIQGGESCINQAEDTTENKELPPVNVDAPPIDVHLIPDGQVSYSVIEEPCPPKEELHQNLVDHASENVSPRKHNLLSKRNYSTFQNQSARNEAKTFPSSKATDTAKRCLDGYQKMDYAKERQTSKKQKIEVTKNPHGAEFSLTAEKHANKKQKLEGGTSCQVYRPVRSLTVPQEFHFNTEKRALVHKETGQCSASIQGSSLPYIPLAEMLQKFQMNLLGDLRMQEKSTAPRNRTLKLTQPKEPRLGTSMRARPPTIKSSAELEEEMLANIPKFKARPLNKRILEAPTLPLPHRSTPQIPEFQEFNLRTMKRALMHQQHPSSVNGKFILQDQERMTSELHSEMTQPSRTKGYQETVDVMASKFKARPLDRRIFLSRGDVGLFTVTKRQTTVPKEFHFATDQRAHHHEVYLQQHHKDAGEHSARISTSHGTTYTGLQVFNDNHHQRTQLDAVACQSTPVSNSSIPLRGENCRRPLGEIQQFSMALETQAVQVQQTKSIKMSDGNGHEERSIIYHRKRAFYAESPVESETFPVHTRPTKELLQHTSPRMAQPRDQFSQNWSFPVHLMR